jgi:hypothetical protein
MDQIITRTNIETICIEKCSNITVITIENDVYKPFFSTNVQNCKIEIDKIKNTIKFIIG